MFPQNTHLIICPSGSHVNHGSHSFVSFLRLSISARCCIGNMNARNKKHEGNRRCAYAVHINNNIITKESQSPIREVLKRSCWRASPGQEASDGSKVRRERKAGPFITYEVQAQMGPVWARTSVSRRQYIHPGDNVCRVRGVIFYKLLAITPNVCVRATTSAACIYEQGWFCSSKLRI